MADARGGSSGPRASGNSGKGSNSKVCCSMLFPRCIHRRLCYALLNEFHTTRPYLRQSLDSFQIDPITAHVIIGSKPSSSGRLQSKSDGRKTKKHRPGKQRKEKSDRTGCLPDSDKLSSRSRHYNRRVWCPRTVGESELVDARVATVVNGRLPSPSPTTEHEVHIDASRSAGRLSCSFHAVLFCSSASQHSHVPMTIEGMYPIYPAPYWTRVAQTA